MQLKNQSDSKDMDNVELFMKRCTLLLVQQHVCISHACLNLELWSLSHAWLSKAFNIIDERHMKEKANSNLVILSTIKTLLDRMSLFEGGLLAFDDDYSERPRLLIHYAFAALQKGSLTSAMEKLKKIREIYDSPTPPGYYDELLHALNAQVIIHVERGDMGGAVQGMHRRLNIVTKWIGNTSFELAHDCLRLGCFYSILCHHEQCAKYCSESLHIGLSYDSYDRLNCTKLLAITYDAMNDNDKAIHQYKRALSMEEDTTMKVKLINALSHLLTKVGGHSQLAIGYLETAINILQKGAKSESTDLCDTKILMGNVMASEKHFSEAIDWYESALDSNPDKNAIHPTNLKALFNIGITRIQTGDMIGASEALSIILDRADKDLTRSPDGLIPVLHVAASICFINKDYAGAVEHFTQCLSFRDGCPSPCQRAGILCNIGSAYFRMEHIEESKNYFYEALMVTESTVKTPLHTTATIKCKLAYILYREKNYPLAHELFSDGKDLANCKILPLYFWKYKLNRILMCYHSKPHQPYAVVTSLMMILESNMSVTLTCVTSL